MITKTIHHRFDRGLSLAAVIALGLFSQACRSKLDVQSKDGGPMPAADTPPPPPTETDEKTGEETKKEPDKPDFKEIKDVMALKGGKLYFQTRDTITIEIKKAVIEGATSFSLLNITNSGNDDSKAVTIVKEATQHFGLQDGFGLAEYSATQVQLQFYPGDPQWKGKFFYGKNILKVKTNDDDENPRYAKIELYLQDFDVFGVAVTSFANNVQVATQTGPNGYQFQGWVNVLSPPTVVSTNATGPKSVLTNGIFNMVNPQ